MWKIVSLVLLSFVYGCCCADDQKQDDLNKLCTVQGIFTVRNPDDCGSFILCKYNAAEIISCPNSTPCYNENLGACVPHTDTCSCKAESNLIKSYCRSKPDSWLLQVPAEDCSMFYVCMGAELDPVAVRCPNGWHYSRAEEDCVTPLRAGCQSLSRMCNDKYNGFRFPAIDCMEFYECSAEAENSPILRVCSVGQYYDGNTSTCIAAEDSACLNENENQPTTTTATTTTITPTTATAPTITIPTTTTPTTTIPTTTTPTTTPTTTTSTSVSQPPLCTAEIEGQYHTHADSYKFYICLNKNPTLVYCGSGYYFDAELKICRIDIDNLCTINAK